MPKLKTFYETITEAVADFAANGYDNVERLNYWLERIRGAALRDMVSEAVLTRELSSQLKSLYKRYIEQAQILQFHPGISKFTYEKVKPKLRAELDRRILASANLIKLDREAAIQKTLQRFSGWATSIPVGGSDVVAKNPVKSDIRKSLVQLSFIQRRVAIDQGAKFLANLSNIIAVDTGAIAAIWHSHFRQVNYSYREDHKERDSLIYTVRDNWAQDKGLMKVGPAGYTDEITMPAEEINCLPGGSVVENFCDVEKIFRRWYSGDIISLVSSTGRIVRATPNHPVLTQRGWVAIGLLDKTDKIVEAAKENIKAPELNNNLNKSSIADLYCTLGSMRNTHEICNGVPPNFHGDGSNQNIDVISFTGPLMLSRKPACCKGFYKFFFTFTNLLLSAVSVVNQSADRLLSSFNSRRTHLPSFVSVFISNLSASFKDAIYNCRFRYSKALRYLARAFVSFVSVPNFVVVEGQSISSFTGLSEVKQACLTPVPNSHGTTSDYNSDSFDTLPLGSKFVDIVDIKREAFTGHVYNLQTKSGWYSVNYIIIHNCRCFYQYITHVSALPANMLTQYGKEEVARVKSLLKG